MTKDETQRKTLRQLNIEHIRKVMRRREAKTYNWPGAPLGHFSCIGVEAEVLREQIADGSVIVVERPRITNPALIATFICLPS